MFDSKKILKCVVLVSTFEFHKLTGDQLLYSHERLLLGVRSGELVNNGRQ
jgi:hypothetical protein